MRKQQSIVGQKKASPQFCGRESEGEAPSYLKEEGAVKEKRGNPGRIIGVKYVPRKSPSRQ